MRGEHSTTIRSALMRLVLLTALPVWLASAILLYKVQNDERKLLAHAAIATADDVMTEIDRALIGARSAALVLAESAEARTDDFRAFHERATEVVRSGVADGFALSDASGQQLANTLIPFGQPLPRHFDPEVLRRVFESEKAVTSDLHVGAARRLPLVTIDVPVMRNGDVVYDLSAGFLSTRLHGILRQTALPNGWQAALLDGKGATVARTEDGDDFVGQAGSVDLVYAMTNARRGTLQTSTSAGMVYAAFSRSDTSDWAVAIEIPSTELPMRLVNPLGISTATTIVLVVLGLVAARVMSGRLAQPIQALRDLALAHGRGEPVDSAPLRLKEANEVAHALAEGARHLADRTRERDRANEQRQRVLIEKQLAEEDARTRSAYFAYLSHELGSPLMAIRALCDALALRIRKNGADERSLECCSRMSDAATHVANVVAEILDYARYEARELELHKEKVDLASEVTGVVNLLEAKASEQHIKLRCEITEPLPPLVADPKRLRQILFNLLSNAIKFTRAKGRVTVSIHAERGWIVLRVIDTGVGISAAELPHVLRPFGQSARRAIKGSDGAGLGLPFSKGLVELHGGSLTLESTLGEGTTVTVRLPQEQRRREPARAARQHAPPAVI